MSNCDQKGKLKGLKRITEENLMAFILILFRSTLIYCLSTWINTENQPNCSERVIRSNQLLSQGNQSNCNPANQIGVESYNTTQKQQIIQNACDLYTDIMKCSLFCYRELINRFLIQRDQSGQLFKSFRDSQLEKRILSFFRMKLSKIEDRIKYFRSKSDLNDLDNIYYMPLDKSLQSSFFTLLYHSPRELLRIIYLQIEL